MPGPILRTDIVEVYVFRRGSAVTEAFTAATAATRPVNPQGLVGLEFLQLRRKRDPMAGSWQPVMGHVEEGETATAAALRELHEETGFRPIPDSDRPQNPLGEMPPVVRGVWQLELVHTYFLASLDAVMHSPGFAVEVETGYNPRIDVAHDAFRWVRRDETQRAFLWPGQQAAVAHIADLLATGAEMGPRLRLR